MIVLDHKIESTEGATKIAELNYNGLYLVENHNVDYWKVYLYSPTGPIKWLNKNTGEIK